MNNKILVLILILITPLFTSAQTFNTRTSVIKPLTLNYCQGLNSVLGLGDTDINTKYQVTKLQKFLASYYGRKPESVITGRFDKTTSKMILHFQRQNDLVANGVFDMDTLKKVESICTKSTQASLAIIPTEITSPTNNQKVLGTRTINVTGKCEPSRGTVTIALGSQLNQGITCNTNKTFFTTFNFTGNAGNIGLAVKMSTAGSYEQQINVYINPDLQPTQSSLNTNNNNGIVLGVSNYCPNLKSNFERGATDLNTNGQVSKLQKYLTNYFNLSENIATGFFGDKTVTYLKDYQTQNNLASSGYLGELTRGKMNEGCR